MEYVDIYNDKHEKLGYTKQRNKLEDGEYRLSCFVWILNDKNELLIQQRLPDAKICPNMWETTSGGVVMGKREYTHVQELLPSIKAMLEEGKTATVLCRFVEYNILADSMLVRNDIPYFIYNSYLGQVIDCSQYVDKMSVLRSGTTCTASFLAGGMMYMYHSTSTSVPTGWLVPLNYINIGRPDKEGEETAKVRLIVPHSQGTADASSSVYPCFYEIQYEQAR